MDRRLLTTVTISLLTIGILLIAISRTWSTGGLYSEILRDIGMILGPVGAIGLLYEVLLRVDFLNLLRETISTNADNLRIEVGPRDIRKIFDIVKTSQNELLLMGSNLTLLQYYGDELSQVFDNVKSARILILDGDSPAVQMRQRQLENPWDYPAGYKQTLRKLQSFWKQSQTKQIRAYDMPPMHFLCVVDRRRMVVCNYSYGRLGIESPHYYFENCDTNAQNNRIMKYYLEAFDFVWTRSREVDPLSVLEIPDGLNS